MVRHAPGLVGSGHATVSLASALLGLDAHAELVPVELACVAAVELLP